jgi:hypothetical protein
MSSNEAELQIGDRVRLAGNGELGRVRYLYKSRYPGMYGIIVRWDSNSRYDIPYLCPSDQIVKQDHSA